MLPSRHRLRDGRDFRTAVRGMRSTTSTLVVHAACPPSRAGKPARVGFAVSRAVGNAVVRNRTKRRLRAAMAGVVPTLPQGTDMVIRANPRAADASGGELAVQLTSALERLERRRSAAYRTSSGAS
ncbi:MAG TPA: ribonuclease P protein component [Dermatophilaceae bacterium]|nr:ribonuclease P protein component [Dermatophilaceae bacterium]